GPRSFRQTRSARRWRSIYPAPGSRTLDSQSSDRRCWRSGAPEHARPRPGRSREAGSSHQRFYDYAMAVRSSRRELEIVGTTAEALNSAPTVQRALDRTLELVTDLLGLQTGWVWLIDPETDHIYSAAARNLPPYLQEPVRMTGSWCLCIEEFRNGSLTPRNVDVMECSRLRPAVRARQTDLTHGLAHHASVPLSLQDKSL